MTAQNYQPGQWVIYRKSKMSGTPGPRAHDVHPASKGETYSYVVDKYWIVVGISDEGKVILRTRRGKEHPVSASDADLRPARWWERWLFRNRFVAVEQGETSGADAALSKAS